MSFIGSRHLWSDWLTSQLVVAYVAFGAATSIISAVIGWVLHILAPIQHAVLSAWRPGAPLDCECSSVNPSSTFPSPPLEPLGHLSNAFPCTAGEVEGVSCLWLWVAKPRGIALLGQRVSLCQYCHLLFFLIVAVCRGKGSHKDQPSSQGTKCPLSGSPNWNTSFAEWFKMAIFGD